MVNLVVIDDIVVCELVLFVVFNNFDCYDVWISFLWVVVSINVMDNCDGLISIIDDGGFEYEEECDICIVIFMISD